MSMFPTNPFPPKAPSDTVEQFLFGCLPFLLFVLAVAAVVIKAVK